ncbi:sodium/hydrogen exchanger 10-like isoform X2 [Argiope bruennichi]|uniref:sodium/hydrogen exchanger 10-like isoform X2 n=1 Tax=Argiope bruennichi TaxID=94029 RepID=UPI0024954093|nr:sodium/hydrogen exchanger 10-like isoform X2 [Argiope bruennichi]
MKLLDNSIEVTENSTDIPWHIHREEAHSIYLSGARSIQFVMVSLFAGIVIYFGSKKYHYPFTVGCFLFGVAVGLLDVHSQFVRNFTYVSRMNPSDMMLTFLPILVFESSFGMDAHMFYRALTQCIILALPGLLFCTALTGIYAKFVLKSYNWSWFTAFLFGSIVSATDPVAVVALLKEMRMPHSFTILIEGESLLNDGVAIVLYETLSHHVFSDSDLSLEDSAIQLIKTCIGAPIFGYISAKIAEIVLLTIYISPVSEMTTILIQAYITYFVAERFLGISAVLAVVLFGVTLNANRMCISPESESLIHTDWRLLSVYANTLIFVIVGILISVHLSLHYDSKDTLLVLATYIILTVLRGVMIALFYPLLKCTGYGITWKESIVLAWGGLRGAVGAALALMFASNPKVNKSEDTSKVLVQVSGIIILTLIINANTVKSIMKLIRFKDVTLVHRLSMGNAIACVSEVREKSIRICKKDSKYQKADWIWLLHNTKIHDPYKGGIYGDDPTMSSLFIPYGSCDECMSSLLPYAPSENEMEELNEAARKKVLRAMKGFFWKQFRNGLIQRRALKFLSMVVDNASDISGKYVRSHELSSRFKRIILINRWLEKSLSKLIEKIELHESTFDKEIQQLRVRHLKGLRKYCSWFYFKWWFEPMIMTVICLNIIQIILDIYYIVFMNKKGLLKIMSALCATFSLFYVLEISIKIFALRFHRYVKNPWNIFDLVLSLFAVLEGTADFVLMSYYYSHHQWISHFRILIALRLLRALRILRILLYNLLSSIRNYYSSELYYAYDVSRGFLFANEAVLKKIDAVVDFGPSAKVPLSVCKENVEEMLDSLINFEQEFPGVAHALQSNRAARRILNRLRIVLDRFTEKSLILREDMKVLKQILFEMTKKIVYAPRIRPIIHDVSKILEESDWVRYAGASDIIVENHNICSYKSGEVIQQAGNNHIYVHIIASGIIKVLWSNPESSSYQMYNQLPNTDTFLIFESEVPNEVWEFLITSQTLGLLGYLQKTKSVTTAICEKDCELVQIPYTFLQRHEEEYQLTYSMWRMVAINIASIMLKHQPRYKDYSEDEIKIRLHTGIMPSIQSVSNWSVPDVIDDMVLIQGRAKDSTTGLKFVGPVYIPNTCRNFTLLVSIKK